MSSHHIVRDEQEPTLLILDPNLVHIRVDNLLEWSPTVIVNATDVEKLLLHGFKLDIVIGRNKDLESIRELLTHQEPVKYLTINQDDKTLDQVLNFMITGHYKAVNVISKFDAPLAMKIESFISKIDVVIYDSQLKWHYSKGHFKKWIAIGQSIVLGNQVDEIIFNGEQLETNNNKFTPTREGFIEISSKTRFWLGECI